MVTKNRGCYFEAVATGDGDGNEDFTNLHI